MNILLIVWIKQDFNVRCLFPDSLLPLALFFSLFLLPITQPRSWFFSCIPAGVEPLTFIFAHLSLTSHSSTPLHYEVQLRPTPQKLTFISLDSLIFQNIYITINSFICFSRFRAARKHALDFLIILAPGEFRFFFVAFTWKLTRCYKDRLTVSFTAKPFLAL